MRSSSALIFKWNFLSPQSTTAFYLCPIEVRRPSVRILHHHYKILLQLFKRRMTASIAAVRLLLLSPPVMMLKLKTLNRSGKCQVPNQSLKKALSGFLFSFFFQKNKKDEDDTTEQHMWTQLLHLILFKKKPIEDAHNIAPLVNNVCNLVPITYIFQPRETTHVCHRVFST